MYSVFISVLVKTKRKAQTMKKLVWSCILFLVTAHFTVHGQWSPLAHDGNVEKIAENPLKGLIPAFRAKLNNFPHSMEYFYIGLDKVLKGENRYDWKAFEEELNRVSDQGKHAIFRFYIDYPNRPSALPQYMKSKGVKTRSYSNYNNKSSVTPDYNNEYFMGQIVNFVKALGKRYDGDTRIAYGLLGIYGYWGEWHNYPNGKTSDMNQKNKDRLLTAFASAFKRTHMLQRDPLATKNSQLKNSMGYHDDSFSLATIGPAGWHFWPKMVKNDLAANWQKYPMGGEIHPSLQGDLWENWPNKNGQDWTTSVKTTHASWFMNQFLFTKASSKEQRNALRATKGLGYELYVEQRNLSFNPTSGAAVKVRIRNRGVAPIYYNWKVEVGLYNTSTKSLTAKTTTNWNIHQILPGKTYEKSVTLKGKIAKGNYQVVMRVINPLEARTEKARKVRFANKTQDQHIDGWLTLGTLRTEKTNGGGNENPNVIVANGTYMIRSVRTQQNVIAPQWNGHNAVMHKAENFGDQRWIFRHLGQNVYTIRNEKTGRYLEVPNARCGNGANVATWTNANDNHKKWRVVTNGLGIYTLKPIHCENRALDIRKGAIGANVQVWDFSAGNANQKFNLVPTERGAKADTEILETLRVSPNPVSDLLRISGLQEGQIIKVTTLTGKQVLSQKVTSAEDVLSVAALPAGLYIISIQGTERIRNTKFIKL